MKKINIYNLLFTIFIIMLLSIIICPNWGITDDHQTISLNNVSRVLEINKSLTKIGRFPQYYTLEHFLFSKIWLNPLFYYFINFIYAIISLVLLTKLLKKILKNKLQYFLFFIILSPAFIECFFRLAPSEKQLFVLISIFLFLFYKFIKTQKNKYLIFSLIISFISFFLKEPMFLLYSGFGFIWYFENRYLLKNDNLELYKKQRSKQIFIFFLVSSIIFLIIYKLITINATTQYNNFFAEQSFVQRIVQSIKIIENYTFSNPIVMVGLPLSILIRFIYWNNINVHFRKLKKLKFLPFYDGLLFGGFLFTLSIIYLGLGARRYLLPVLGFSFIPVLFYISYAFKYHFSKIIKVTISVLFGILLLGSAVNGINHAIELKIQPYQFQKMLKTFVPKLNNDIDNSDENGKIDIFLPGIDRSKVENYASLGKFLIYNGIPKNKFDFKSMDTISNNTVYNYYKSHLKQYSIYQSEKKYYPKSEDYLLLYNIDVLPINYSDYLNENQLTLEKIFPNKIYSLTTINNPLDVIFKRVIDKFGYKLKHKEDMQFINNKIYSWSILKVKNMKSNARE